jgi:arsenate reductase (thioredoxin)
LRNVRRRLLGALCAVATTCALAQVEQSPAQAASVVFVCEHGSVKSLIAASLFNQAAGAKSLPLRAVARGVVPDESVPSAIAEALARDGFQVKDFKPLQVSRTEAAAATRVVAISLDSGLLKSIERSEVEKWNDVPAASTDYIAAREALRRHVDALLAQLATTSSGAPSAP